MKTFKIIRDGDLGLNTVDTVIWSERKSARAIVFDNNNILLLHVTKKHYHKLPGGGIEKEESIENALKREVMEEAGCEITNIRSLGVIEEYRSDVSEHQISYCFIADVLVKKKEAQFTEEELADGFQIVWTSLDNALDILQKESGNIKDYIGKFINDRELSFLQEARKQLSE